MAKHNAVGHGLPPEAMSSGILGGPARKDFVDCLLARGIYSDPMVVALPDTPECFLPDAQILTTRGPRLVDSLRPGQELVSGLPGHAAIVHSVHPWPLAERNIVFWGLRVR